MKKLIVSCCVVLTLVGCQTESIKSTSDTVGKYVARVIGKDAAESDNELVRELGKGLGTSMGALIGSEMSRFLEQRDQEKMTKATTDAANTGQTQTWSNPETGASGQVAVVGSEKRSENVTVPVLKANVQHVPPLDLIAETYAATAGSNIRRGPGQEFPVVDGLVRGELVYVVGKVQGKPWYFVADGGVGNGFVHQKLLNRSSSVVSVDNTTHSAAEIENKDVQASIDCQKVEQSATLANGTSKTDTFMTCKDPNGWSQHPV